LADRTGLGEAVFGGVLLGASTSLSGIVTSLTAASDGLASLAVSNAVGGITAQTAFLVLADMIYRKVNLEHAAADANNMLMAAMLVLMVSLPLGAAYAPAITIFGIHPVSILLFAVYLFGTKTAYDLRNQPMWRPQQTDDTRADEPDDAAARKRPLWRMVAIFVALSLVLAASGYAIARAGAVISSELGISQTVVGALMTAVATSLPELVTTLAAVRRGAPTARLIVDANESWHDRDIAAEAAALAALGVEMVEQPVIHGQEARLAGVHAPLPLCADESCHTRADLDRLGDFDAVNIKLDKAGGLTEALALAREAKERGFRLMVGCMLGTSLGIAPAALLAQGADWIDLDGALLLAEDRDGGLALCDGQLQPGPLWGMG